MKEAPVPSPDGINRRRLIIDSGMAAALATWATRKSMPEQNPAAETGKEEIDMHIAKAIRDLTNITNLALQAIESKDAPRALGLLGGAYEKMEQPTTNYYSQAQDSSATQETKKLAEILNEFMAEIKKAINALESKEEGLALDILQDIKKRLKLNRDNKWIEAILKDTRREIPTNPQ